MKTSDLLSAIFIIIVFIGLYVLSFLVIGTKYIQDHWPLYRCNPTVMPFSSMFGHDAGENFTYCIQNMQSDYMGYLLEPINYMTSMVVIHLIFRSTILIYLISTRFYLTFNGT